MIRRSTGSTESIHHYYARCAARIVEREGCDASNLPDVETWQGTRANLYSQFMKSVGLEPMPPRGDLGAIETGVIQGNGYTVRKLAYQLIPDCWGSAHFYRPDGLPEDSLTPAVLYACGHSNPGVVALQEHAIAWAWRGYSCLIFDTIQQHDNPGEHHGLNTGRTPDWIGLGYSAAGGELFNGLRALDLLLEQPGVDPKRIGVTGISGGGAQSFFLAIADSRITAVATVAGVSDPAHAIPHRQVLQHCDCIYPRNIFGHDIALYAALIAPRPLLYCFARHDTLFTPEEFRDLHRRTQARYESLGCGDRCALYEYDGPHGYNDRKTTDAIHDWFDLHVAGEEHVAVDTLAIKKRAETVGEAGLSVFHGRTPEPNYLHLLPEMLTLRGQLDLPLSPSDWPALKEAAVTKLRQEVFSQLDAVETPQTLVAFGDWQMEGGKFHRRAWRGRLDGMEQYLLELAPGDGHGRGDVIVALGAREQEALPLAGDIWAHCKSKKDGGGMSVIAIEARACGMNAFPAGLHHHLNREGCLVGLTPTMLMIQDLQHLWPLITEMPSVQRREIVLYGKGEGAIAMLFHALLNQTSRVKAVVLEDLPASFSETAFQIMGILRTMTIPHAVGLLAPTPVALVNSGGTAYQWYYATRAHARVGSASSLIVADSLGSALEALR